MKKYSLLLLCGLMASMLMPTSAIAQKKKKDKFKDEIKKDKDLEEHKDPTLDLNPNVKDVPEEEEEEKKKKKKNIYLKYKIKRRFITSGSKRKETKETFGILKNYEKPNKYVDYYYYYNTDKKKIQGLRRGAKIDGEIMKQLHGPYVKKLNGVVIEEGFFYKGSKHGTWCTYKLVKEVLDTAATAKEAIITPYLVTKEKFHEGLAKDAKVTFFDGNKTKMKEIIPYQNGVKHGTYYKYYQSGRIAIKGVYYDDHKIGKWEEFYDRKRKRNKKFSFYPTKGQIYKLPQEPTKVTEWDEDGKQI